MYFRAPFYSKHGVVASEHPLASIVGANVLRSGGNAVDASVAVGFTLSVVLPHLSGLGGDFFAIIKDPNDNIYVINGSGYSPRGLTLEFMMERGFNAMPIHSSYSITIPGMVDGIYGLWSKFGSIDWEKLIQPAIRIASKGFPTTRSLCNALKNYCDKLANDYGSRTTYLSGSLPSEGDVIGFKGLAKALELISDDPRNFYEGDIAVRIIDYLKSKGGVIELDDFKNYHHEWQNPIKINYRDKIIYEMPPNSQGVTTLHIIKLIEDIDFNRINCKSIDRIKVLVDASKAAYYIRDKFVSDPKAMKIHVNEMLSAKFIDKMKKMQMGSLDEKTLKDADTTFYAIADSEGWLISCIQSIFHHFGSCITEPTYNITLNSRASSFSLDYEHVNRLEPRKKPLHTLSAIILKDDLKWIGIGLSGGNYRPLLHAQLLNLIIDYKMHPQASIEHPRFRWQPYTNIIEYEAGFKGKEINDYQLRQVEYPSRIGVAAIVELKGKVKAGYTDIRGDGLPIGLE